MIKWLSKLFPKIVSVVTTFMGNKLFPKTTVKMCQVVVFFSSYGGKTIMCSILRFYALFRGVSTMGSMFILSV